MVLFTNKSNSKRFIELFRISTPLMVDQLFVMFMGIINTILVAKVGEFAVSGVSMIDSMGNVLIALYGAFSIGATIVIAQYLGSRDKINATNAAAQSIATVFLFSFAISLIMGIFSKSILNAFYGSADENVLIAANQYFSIINFSFPMIAVTQVVFGILRGTGDTKTPMKLSVGMNIINFVLCMILINGIDLNIYEILLSKGHDYPIFDGLYILTPALEVRGAGIAITIARITGLVIGIFLLTKKSYLIKFKNIKQFIPSWEHQKAVLSISVPAGIEQSLFNIGKLIIQMYVVKMGTTAVVSFSIAGMICGFANIPGAALSSATMILVSQRIGRNDDDDVVKTIGFNVVVASIMMFILGVFGIIFSNKILSFYNFSPETFQLTKNMLIVGLISTPFLWASSFVAPAGLRATGDVKNILIYSMVSMFVFRIGLGYYFGIILHMGAMGPWIAMIIDWLVRSILFGFRILSGKWKGKGVVKKEILT